jgi:hypothetical protein
MQIPNPNPAGSVWNLVSGVSGVICAIFAVLLWAGITPASLFAWRRWSMTQRRGATLWVGALLSASIFLSGYSFYSWIHPSHPIVAGVSAVILGLLVIAAWSVLLRPQPQSKLVIHWANYRAVENGGEEYPVGDFLRQIISGDSLVFDIENHNFVIGKRNFVEHDPLTGKEKRLQVNYSYGGKPPVTTERREHGRLLLPEDSAIQWLRSEIDRIKAAQPKPSQYPLGGLRLKILEQCVELKGFLGEHGQEPKVERQLPESQEDFMQRWRSSVDPWRAKFLGDFRLKFGDSIPRLQDEIRVRAGVDDFGLNNLIIKAASDPNGNVKSVEGLTRRLWELDYEINA